MEKVEGKNEERIREIVRERYGETARQGASGCCGSADVHERGKQIGYSDDDLAAAPEGANLGLGCGNPLALASLREGEVVLDLGSGAGFDAFLAARQVGESGRVIGVDMTSDMVERARANAAKVGLANVEFREGCIEALPVEDASVDVIISNCVINLSPEKERVFREAYRALKPGGRLMVSDIVLSAPLPATVRDSVEALVGCIAGAALRDDYLGAIRAAGFVSVDVRESAPAGSLLDLSDSIAAAARDAVGGDEARLRELGETVQSISVIAVK